MAGLHDLLEGQNKQAVQGLSFGGQMHGLVLLDAQDHVIRPPSFGMMAVLVRKLIT